jgi:hypothetical protein
MRSHFGSAVLPPLFALENLTCTLFSNFFDFPSSLFLSSCSAGGRDAALTSGASSLATMRVGKVLKKQRKRFFVSWACVEERELMADVRSREENVESDQLWVRWFFVEGKEEELIESGKERGVKASRSYSRISWTVKGAALA